jgi:hypothetical protein
VTSVWTSTRPGAMLASIGCSDTQVLVRLKIKLSTDFCASTVLERVSSRRLEDKGSGCALVADAVVEL